MNTTQPLVDVPWNCATSAGRYSRDDAKMTGMTPAWFTLIGMYVLVPPYCRRPIIRFAYWTGTRRWDCSTNTTAATITRPTAITIRNAAQPLAALMAHRAVGKLAAIWVK